MIFSFHTLGCKVNQFETDALCEIVKQKGHEISDQNADVFVINTCTVTAVSDKKNIKLIKKVKKENPQAIIAVCGCFAQISPEKASALDGVDIVCGTDNRAKVIDMCIDSYQNDTKHQVLREKNCKNPFEVLPMPTASQKTRKLLKIQDGCNNFCTYCIIPHARGLSRSIPLQEAISQVEILHKQGVKEIIITGIEIASYGKDIGSNLADLLEILCKTYPKINFRLGSLEPRIITEEFCDKLSKFDNLNPHFHLSLQSGCDTVLKRMNRKYNTELFYGVCVLLRKYFKTPSITTDLIVGFPGETEQEFEQTLNFINKCQFSSMHIFPYSIREGTPAAKMDNQIDINIKNSRAKKAKILADDMELEFLNQFIGKTIEIIVETTNKEFATGHSQHHFVIKCNGNVQKGEKVSVLIQKNQDNVLFGDIKY